jgi:AcrR family transcriptional regulator
VAAAWRLRDASPRRASRGLSLDRIVSAGIKVASIDGLGALSMSRVAGELGAATMALYRHVSGKDELLAHMVDAAIGVPPESLGGGESWRDGLTRWALAHLTVLRRHPWVVRVPISGPPLMPNSVLWFDRGLGCLRDTGLDERIKPAVLLLVSGFVRNQATLEADLLTAARIAGTSPAEAGAAYARTLAALTDAMHLPALHAVLAAGTFDGPEQLPDDVPFGLGRVLDGIEVLIGSARGA